jgi:membrane protease YdiL (CAAX protease family)
MERFRDPRNRLFVLARSGRRMTRWWVVPLLLLLFSFAAAPAALIPLDRAEEAGLWSSALTSAAYFVGGYLPVAILVGVWVWRRERRGIATLGFNRLHAARNALLGFAFGAGLMALGVMLVLTSGDATLEFEQTDTLGYVALAPALALLLAWLVQGTTEELMFRGWMLQTSGAQIGPLPGIAFTTVIFALGHLANPGVTALSTLNIALIGVLFVALALFEGGIWAASGFHAAWNWTQSSVFGFQVSGLAIGGGSLVRVLPDGSGDMLGGEFGFEGSVAATTTIIIGILLIFALASREQVVGRR